MKTSVLEAYTCVCIIKHYKRIFLNFIILFVNVKKHLKTMRTVIDHSTNFLYENWYIIRLLKSIGWRDKLSSSTICSQLITTIYCSYISYMRKRNRTKWQETIAQSNQFHLHVPKWIFLSRTQRLEWFCQFEFWKKVLPRTRTVSRT